MYRRSVTQACERANDMASNSSGLSSRHLLVRDWAARRGERMQRLGRYLHSARTRTAPTVSIRDVVKQARALGERLNTAKVSQIEQLRDDGPEDADELRNDVTFMAVWFMLRFYGYSLTDLERYMLTGEETASDPDEQQRADLIQRAFLSLPEQERGQLEQYIDFLYQQASQRTLDPDSADEPPRSRRPTGHRPSTSHEMARLASQRAIAYAQPDDDK